MGRDQSAAPSKGPSRRVIVLGSTGSIGTQTLDVIEHLNALHERGEWGTRLEVVGLVAGANENLLREQVRRFGVARSALGIPGGEATSTRRKPGVGPRVGGGVGHEVDAAERLVREVECDLVVAAISGIAGLPATLAAVELGRTVALANKETLVAAGSLVTAAARDSGSRLLPIDSEHSGVWQCLGSATPPPVTVGAEVARVTLTASGGPFRTWSKAQMERATVEDALKHPTWSMGRKVTIDSATLMNKALEVIEAHWLFGLPGDRIDVRIHPQSLVHAMVEFADGSVVSQVGAPDMRTPIQHAITWPGRAPGCSRRLGETPRLDFETPDHDRFPALALAYRALDRGGSAGAVLNAANEVAVGAFLSGRIPFNAIARTVSAVMEATPVSPIRDLNECLAADALARAATKEHISRAPATA